MIEKPEAAAAIGLDAERSIESSDTAARWVGSICHFVCLLNVRRQRGKSSFVNEFFGC